MTTIFHHTSQTHKSTPLLHTDTPRQRLPAYNETVRNDHLYITLHNYGKTMGPAWQDTTPTNSTIASALVVVGYSLPSIITPFSSQTSPPTIFSLVTRYSNSGK